MQLAVRRLPASLEFPPQRTASELQKSLAAGDALVVFHAAGGGLYGFLLTSTDIHLWQLADGQELRGGVGELLRALGNFGASRTLSAAELASDDWRKIAADAFSVVFAGARLDLKKTNGLIIVPDDVLWYLPFDTLIPDAGNPEATLADAVPIRYGPTAALAVSRSQPLRRPRHAGIVANEIRLGGDNAESAVMLTDLEKAVIGPLRIPTPLPQPAALVAPLLDSLVVLDDVESDRMGSTGWLPLPRERGAADIESALTTGGPEVVVVTGFATAAEQGLKAPRRGSARNVRPGSEVFQTLCGMMASGARTILLSRWRTGGRTNLELVREFVQELPHLPPTEAWQRACLLARETPLDPKNEPRLKGLEASGELPTAEHPFFWAGYVLVDTTPRPDVSNNPAEVEVSKAPPNDDAKAPAKAETSRKRPAHTDEDDALSEGDS
jgi:hypothetical protein